MRAVQMTRIGGPEVLRVVEVPGPQADAGFVRVRNRAIAVNFHDINTRRGDEPDIKLPAILGTDFAGIVDAVGDGVEHIKIGDRVLGINMGGAYAEAALAMAAVVVPIPAGLSFEQAAACPVPGLTAYFLTHQVLPVTSGMTVVAHAAAGSVGCFMGGLLQQLGATSIGLVSSDEKADVARRAGYTHVVNYRKEDPVARVRQLTGGDGACVVYDSVAGPQFQRSFDMTAVDGMAILFGHAAGDPPPESLKYWLRSRRNLGLRTYFLGATMQAHLEMIPAAYDHLFQGLMSGAIYLPIETMPLVDATRAHARIEQQQTVGKIILIP
ncbi:MAG: zinc-binding dehydrogenase [Candidatus Binatia bacterium]|jgi:NADPH:quinone reductase